MKENDEANSKVINFRQPDQLSKEFDFSMNRKGQDNN